MSDVFLSYSRKDTDFVRAIYKLLDARKREAWIDLHDIDYSVKWWEEICGGIDGADNFVLFVSPNSLKSLFCHKEIQHALEHKKRIIPFLIGQIDEQAILQAWQDDPSFTNYEQLARDNWDSIRTIQWIDYTQLNDENKGVDALLKTVDTDPERVRLHTRLLLRLRDWEGGGRNPSGLLRGDELTQYEEWLAESRLKGIAPHPTDEQEAYIIESRHVQDELEEKRVQRERLVRRFRTASIALAVFFVVAVAATLIAVVRGAETARQVSAGNTQIAIIGNTLTPIPPKLTAVAQTVVAGSYMIESLNLSGEANSILRTDEGNAETAALLSIRVLRKIYLGSADAALVASASRLNTAPRVFPSQGMVSSVAFSPDGKTFLAGTWTGGGDNNPGKVELRTTAGGAIVWTQNVPVNGAHTAAFSPDGKLIVVAATDHTARILNAADGSLVRSLQGHSDQVQGAVFSPDGMNILTIGAGSDRTVRQWNAATGQQLYSVPSGAGYTVVFFFPDGKTFYASDSVFNSADGALIPDSGVGGGTLAISPDGRTYLSGLRTTPQLRAVGSGQILREFAGHTGGVKSAAFSRDGKWLITGSDDNTARVWEVASGKQLLLLSGNASTVNAVAFSPDGTKVLTGSGFVRLWDITAVNQQLTFTVPAGITASALSSDGKAILLGTEEGNSGLWDLNDGKLLSSFTKMGQDIKSLAISPDGKYVAIPMRAPDGSNNIGVDVYEIATGKVVKTFASHPHEPVIGTIAFSSDSKMLFAMDFDDVSRLWDIDSGQLLRELVGQDPLHHGMSMLSPDARIVALDDGNSWWDISTGSQLNFPPDMRGGLIAFSSDGNLVAISDYDRIVKVWKVSTRSLVNTFEGHTDRVLSLGFSPDNKLLVTGSADKSARVWNVSTGQLVRVLNGHTAAVTGVAFTPDGRKIVTTSMDKTVRTWIADYNDLVAYACTLVGRDLSREERVLYGVSGDDPTCPQFEAESGAQSQSLVPTMTAIPTFTPRPPSTPIATPTQTGAVP